MSRSIFNVCEDLGAGCVDICCCCVICGEEVHNICDRMVNMFSKAKIRSANYEKHYINKGMEDEMEVIGYRRCSWYEILSWLGILFSLGFLRLVFVWIPRLHLASTHKRCPLSQAEKLLVIERFNTYKTYYIEDISDTNISHQSQTCDRSKDIISSKVKGNAASASGKDFSTFRSVEVKKNIYIWVDVNNEFLKLTGLGPGLKNSDFYNFDSLNEETHSNLTKLYGPNEIVVPVQSYLELVLSEITNPFYIFQGFSIVFWFVIAYYTYTGAIIVFTILSIFLSVRQIHEAQINLSKTVHASDAKYLETKRADGLKNIISKDLVPGDTVVIESSDCTMPCDAILLSGTCIVNESMLTGESVPLTKTALPKTDEAYQEKECSMHILYSGTKIIQTRRDESKPVLALVIRTGYSTAKGNLVRSILYPPPVDYKFEKGVYKFITIIGILSAFASAISAGVMIANKKPAYDVVTNALQLLTNVIPAALPGAMTLSKVYAVRRLKKEKIYCINSRVVNVAGSVDCVCFDKTGTITEDGLDVWGVVPVINALFQKPVQDPKLMEDGELKFGLASCHSLSLIDGKVSGDPLDAKMFQYTGWTYEEPQIEPLNESTICQNYPVVYPKDKSGNKGMKISLVHQYQFVSKLQRMSAIVKNVEEDDLMIFTKGSPEMIASLCKQDTVPYDFSENLNYYAEKGFRVLALGYKRINNSLLQNLKSIARNSIENDLIFLGFLVLENKIKKESKGIIKNLNDGQFKIVMITGDNILTAVSVAKECDIVSQNEMLIKLDMINNEIYYSKSQPELKENGFSIEDVERGDQHSSRFKLALTGQVWERIKQYHPDIIPHIVAKGAIYARVSSDQKQQIVMELQNIGYCVMMCGDGANDCGALKAANVGISLSEAEASVASPLTSAEQNISCAVKTVREGRAALTTSFGLIKFLMIYCLVQFIFTFICNYFGEFVTDYEYLVQDVVIAVHFAFHFGRTDSYKGPLAPETPLTSILDFSPLFSIASHFAIFLVFQILAVFTMSLFPWHSHGPTNNNYALYFTSLYQLIITVISVSRGEPYRKPLYTNFVFTIAITIVTALLLYATLLTPQWVTVFFGVSQPPDIQFPLVLLALSSVNFLISVVFEKFIIDFVFFKPLRHLNCNESKSKRSYIELVNQELNISLFDKFARTFDNNGVAIARQTETSEL